MLRIWSRETYIDTVSEKACILYEIVTGSNMSRDKDGEKLKGVKTGRKEKVLLKAADTLVQRPPCFSIF